MVQQRRMPLQDLSNNYSIQSSIRAHKPRHSPLFVHMFGSDESEMQPVPNTNDGIYNAQRVGSDEQSTMPKSGLLQEVYHTNPMPADCAGLCRRVRPRSLQQPQLIEPAATKYSKSKLSTNGHCRGWSMNDLNCVIQLHSIFSKTKYIPSPLSTEALEVAASTDAYPHIPPCPPLCRRPTPDGIPSFGSREAQELRLEPPSRLDRLGGHIRQRLYPSQHNVGRDEYNIHVPDDSQTISVPSIGRHLERPAEMLKRLSGMVRPVSFIAEPQTHRTVALPRGVRVASSPGDLAIADDGSRVRGRFGNRVSGHGVGQRTIDIHPLARRPESSAIEEAVNAINKACGYQDIEGQHGSSSAMSGDGVNRHRRSNHLERSTERNTNTVEASTAAPALQNERLATHVLEEQRRENARLRAALRLYQTPFAALPRSVHRTNGSRSHATTYRSARAHNTTSDPQPSESDTVGASHMNEPAAYDWPRFLPDRNSSVTSPLTVPDVGRGDADCGLRDFSQDEDQAQVPKFGIC